MISTLRFRWLMVLVPLLLVMISSCTAEEKYEAQLYATLYARDGVVPPTKYLTMAAQHLGVTIPLATPTPAAPQTPTMSFYEFSGTQVAQQQSISLTQSANELQMERERLAAEARAASAATSAWYAQQTAQAYSQNLTAEARVYFSQQTAWAQATHDMGTVIAASTATAWQWGIDQSNTQVSANATKAVLPTHAIWTQNAVYAVETITAGEAKKVELSAQRERLQVFLKAYGPWAILAALAWIFGKGFAKYVQIRLHGRDEHGRRQSFSHTTNDGAIVYVDADRMQEPIVKVTKDGDVIRYASNQDEQARVNHEAKVVDALAVLPTSYAPLAAKLMNANFGRTSGTRVNVSVDTSMGPALEEAERKFIEEAGNV